ncbi:MAG: alpha-glucan family phosphorylase [Halioglobus sp.]|jgi:glycogen phosphorylase
MVDGTFSRWHANDPIGAKDTQRAAQLLAARLPPQLQIFAQLAYDFSCFWKPEGRQLFSQLDPHAWDNCERNPVRMLVECPTQQLVRAAQDRTLLSQAEAVWAGLQRHHARPFVSTGEISAASPVAYLSAEYGLYQSLPIYSGGLGMLAGDYLKEASDACIPLVAVGLYYRQGYFHQRLDASLWQTEYWLETPPDRCPVALVTDEWGIPVTISLRLWGEEVVLQIWRAAVGRTSLYLLDADREENSQIARWLTSRLYDSNREIRLGQYALLGIGGTRALRKLGVEPAVLHLNEGHAAFAAFEMAREAVEVGIPSADAFRVASERLVFTTHTPVPAGNETYSADELHRVLGDYPSELDLTPEEFMRSGRINPDDTGEPLGLTVLALRNSRSTNGVSRIHGKVSRGMWQPVWPGRRTEEVPIGHITNGVHLPTWMAAPMRRLMDKYMGDDWIERAADPVTWEAVEAIPDRELWAVRNEMRALTVHYVRKRNVDFLLNAGRTRANIEDWAEPLSPDTLTVGSARRLATYKRIHLLPHGDPRRFRELLLGDPPVQWLVAGKAHPLDGEAKQLLQRTSDILGDDEVRRHVVYIEDYDMAVATRLVAGCDVWINVPRPPMEACGTSGMKAVFNGVLNLSVLDGWWDEAYNGENGWAISAEPAENEAARDDRDRHRVLDLFEREVLPLFYDRDDEGVPRGWVRMLKNSLRSNGPRFCTSHMLQNYIDQVYSR